MGWIVAIPLVPAAVFLLFFLVPRKVRDRLLALPILAMATSFALSIPAFLAVWPGGEHAAEEGVWELAYQIGIIGGKPFDVILRLDPFAAVMLLVVTIVGLAVQVYSLSYMRGEPRIAWYYAVLSLFTAAMLLLVLAGDYLLFYMAWEVMGLCSYLLIGFWHTTGEARQASIKAFLVTRVGDVGFALGLAYMWATAHSFDFHTVLPAAAGWAPGVATAIALLLFFGAMGKSAQVPLHVWLPDAMAGPTPASALIHAATMVAAGVFLVARSLPIFEASGVALEVVLVIGAVTAFMAATMGCVQYDIKKILAYSTISQLGYMFLGLGTGAVAAGMFHLFTHAFFKSLLFLGAGSIIHSLHTQDIRDMGGIAGDMKVTTGVFTIGTLALAGIAPFAGFFSKDLILDHLWMEGHYVVFAVALATAGLTAFYMARLWFRVFPPRPDRCKTGHAHEADWKMLAPMVVLAGLAIVSGFSVTSFGHFLGSEAEWPQVAMASVSTAVALAGIGLGWLLYGRARETEPLRAALGPVYTLIRNKYWFDLVYEQLIALRYERLSAMTNVFDKQIINGAVNGVGKMCRWGGVQLRRLQAGRVQVYQRYAVVAVLVLMVVLVVVRGA